MLIPTLRPRAPRRNRPREPLMSVVYILAHFDDEYCALPMIREAAREGLAQRFIYLADYRDAALGERRLQETRLFLRRQGIAESAVSPLGLGSGVFDQNLHRGAGVLYPRLAAAVAAGGLPTRLVVPAWEGGHMDHDACAFMAVRLAARLGGVPVRQFTLYNGPGLAGPLLRGGAPLTENGPRMAVPLRPAEWLDWMAQVRAFPSQAYAWSGIWPAMFAGMAQRGGFAWQPLAPERVEARPHAGPLFYERMFKVAYAEVRAALDDALGVRAQVPAPRRRSDGSTAR
jgi:LmbE family N-acetylglucosaminyl deacetylase